MSEREGLSGCAITAIVAGAVLLLATLVGCGLLVMFWGVGSVRVESEPFPPPVQVEPEPAPEER